MDPAGNRGGRSVGESTKKIQCESVRQAGSETRKEKGNGVEGVGFQEPILLPVCCLLRLGVFVSLCLPKACTSEGQTLKEFEQGNDQPANGEGLHEECPVESGFQLGQRRFQFGPGDGGLFTGSDHGYNGFGLLGINTGGGKLIGSGESVEHAFSSLSGLSLARVENLGEILAELDNLQHGGGLEVSPPGRDLDGAPDQDFGELADVAPPDAENPHPSSVP